MTKEGRYSRRVQDLPFQLKPVFLEFEDHQYRCTEEGCEGRIFVPQVPCIPKKGRMTRRLEKAIAKDAFGKSTFLTVAARYYVSEETVRRVFMKKLEHFEMNVQHEPITHLGIDEAHLANEMRCVLVDTSNRHAKLIDILPKRTKTTVEYALTHICCPENIRTVTMDMSVAYREAVELCLPDAKIIIDHFHVTMHLIEAMEKCRKDYYESLKAEIEALPDAMDRMAKRKQLESLGMNHYWFIPNQESLRPSSLRKLAVLCRNYPVFGYIHALKESFRDVYTSETREDAERRYDRWVASIPEGKLYEPFRAFTKMVERWHKWIFNYFDEPVGERHSNGPIEALNGTIKNIMRSGYGYKYEILRGKLLYGETRVELTHRRGKYGRPCECIVKEYLDTGIRKAETMRCIRDAMARLAISDPDCFGGTIKSWYNNNDIDRCMQMARENNNIGGRILGAACELDECAQNETMLIKRGVPFDGLELAIAATIAACR